jgi:TatD DNase family protein
VRLWSTGERLQVGGYANIFAVPGERLQNLKEDSELQLAVIFAKEQTEEYNLKTIENDLPQFSHSSLFIDTHCHLDMAAYSDDLEEVLDKAHANHVKKIVTIGIDLASSRQAVTIARSYPQVSATIGIHPHDVDNLKNSDYTELEKLYLDHSQYIVGFGEIGLDYVKQHSDPAKQRDHFRKQLDLAHTLKLPVVVHNRDANDDTLKILREASPLDYGGIMHCFSGDIAFAHKVLDLGMLISIPGIVTFKNANILQEVAREIPLTSMVLETDGPFLAPHPYRGKRNEPTYLLYTAKKIAELREIDIEQLSRQTTANAENLFKFNRM